MRFLFAIGPSGVLFALAPASAQAEDVPLPDPITPTGTLMEANTSAPRISGDRVSYTDQPIYNVRSSYPAKLGPPPQMVETIARDG